MGLWRQYNLVVDTFERKRRNIHLSTEHERTPPSKIKKKDKNKCSFSSSLFCSRLPTYISCWVGSDDDDDARMHEYHYKAKIARSLARNSRRTGCALTNTSAERTSKKLVFFCYDDERQLCISLRFFCLIEAIIIAVSSLRRRRDGPYRTRPGTSFETHFRC